ncbi:MAG: DUF1501 domain-containing protein [Planctomycetes bacterium]|nr:DUF1501 domain-containing protein [Planctomycetota bacterium]
MRRRTFVQLCGYTALAALVPSLHAFGAEAEPVAAPRVDPFAWKRSVILIELRGGNDGMNTVIPYADRAYRRLRPTLAIPADQVLKIDARLGLHPALKALIPAFKDGDAAGILGLGYPHPNRSHFRGIDIWNTGSNAEELLGDGWMARILRTVTATAPQDRLADGIVLGFDKTMAYGGFGPLLGDGLQTIIMNSPQEFIDRARTVRAQAGSAANPAMQRILAVEEAIQISAERMAKLVAETPPLRTPFPRSALGGGLATVARLIAAGAVAPVFKLAIDGFDTHANQLGGHAALLADLGDSVAAFRSAMQAAGTWDRCLVATYSEFGRRAGENGSGGTDHGTAAPHFLLGGKVAGGWHGAYPSLAKLEDDDLAFTTDFRQLYLAIARQWWGYGGEFLSAKGLKPLDLIRA